MLMTVRDPLLLKQVGAERTMYGQTGVYLKLTIISLMILLRRRGNGMNTASTLVSISIRLR